MTFAAKTMHPNQSYDSAVSLLGALTATTVLGALLVWAGQHVSRTHRRRLEHRPSAPPVREQTWEAEGGRPLEPDSTPPLVR